MNKEKMHQLILEALSRKLGDGFTISIEKVLKTNCELQGLIIMRNPESPAPTIYLDSFYEDLENGMSIEAVTEKILHIYIHSFRFAQGTKRYENGCPS